MYGNGWTRSDGKGKAYNGLANTGQGLTPTPFLLVIFEKLTAFFLDYLVYIVLIWFNSEVSLAILFTLPDISPNTKHGSPTYVDRSRAMPL
jgi:hypothetical protein